MGTKGSTISRFLNSLRQNKEKNHPSLPMSAATPENSLDYAQSIIDTVRDPMLVLDADLCVITASRSFCQTFHVSAAETEGTLVYELGNGQWNIPKLRELLERVLPDQSHFNDYEVTHHFPSIGPRTMLLNARKVWRPGNHSHRILLAIEDITPRKEAEDRLAAIAKELQRSNEDLDQFARVAGHDLRAPINTMVSYSQLLERRFSDLLDAQGKTYIKHIIDGGKNVMRLIQDILHYAQVARADAAPPQPASVQTACEQAKTNLEDAITGSKAEVNCIISPDAKVNVELSRLAQVLQNLIGNGIHYASEKRTPMIEVSCLSHGPLWQFAVRDNGMGIDTEFVKTIFEPFKRLHGQEKPGSGIGLATCKRIIERAEGTIWADSIVGHGSTFYFLLPKATQTP